MLLRVEIPVVNTSAVFVSMREKNLNTASGRSGHIHVSFLANYNTLTTSESAVHGQAYELRTSVSSNA
jgi:hypothetical protein